METGLRERTISAFLWTLSGQWVKQATSFVITMILARLLTPSDFGTVAIITVFTSYGVVFINSGFSTTLVQAREVTDVQTSSIFWSNLALGLVMTLGFAALCPLLGRVYGIDGFTAFGIAMSSLFLLGAPSMVHFAMFQRDLDFKRPTVVNNVSTLIAGICGVVMALNGFGIWSLIVYLLVNQLVTTGLIIYWSQWRPRLLFSWRELRKLSGFSLSVLGNKLIFTTTGQLDRFVLGKWVSPHELGLYNRAQSLMDAPMRSSAAALAMILLPAFAKVQDDNPRARRAFTNFMAFASFFLFPVLATLAINAEVVIRILLTDRWIAAAPYLKLFCLIGLTIPLESITRSIVLAKGHPQLLMKLELLRGALLLSGIVLGLRWGVYGVLVAKLTVTYFVVGIQLWLTLRNLDWPLAEAISSAIPSLLRTAGFAALLWYLAHVDFVHRDGFDLIIRNALAVTIYLVVSRVTGVKVMSEAFQIVRKRVKRSSPPKKA